MVQTCNTPIAATITNINNAEGKIIEANGKWYQLKPLLVTDMACLVQLLNLTEVYSPTSTIKCCWCDCTAAGIHDFDIEEWSFLVEDKWQEREKRVCVSYFFNKRRRKCVLRFFDSLGRAVAQPGTQSTDKACQGEWGSDGSVHDTVTIGADYPQHNALLHGHQKQTLQSAEPRSCGG